VGSSAYESIRWEAAGVCQLFQSVECPQIGQDSKARGSVRSRPLDDTKRDYASSDDKNVQGVCAQRFVTIPVDESRTSYTHHELGRTLQ
jgi:hypothetical protein